MTPRKDFVERIAYQLDIKDDIEGVEANLDIAVDVLIHGGGTIDFDWLVNISHIVGFSVPYQMYVFIANFYGDDDLLELNQSNYDELYRCITYYMNNAERLREN